MKIIEQINKTIKGLKADQIKAAQAHDWAEFDRLQRLKDSAKRDKESWEVKLRGRSA